MRRCDCAPEGQLRLLTEKVSLLESHIPYQHLWQACFTSGYSCSIFVYQCLQDLLLHKCSFFSRYCMCLRTHMHDGGGVLPQSLRTLLTSAVLTSGLLRWCIYQWGSSACLALTKRLQQPDVLNLSHRQRWPGWWPGCVHNGVLAGALQSDVPVSGRDLILASLVCFRHLCSVMNPQQAFPWSARSH
jgi:hypothetical protein